MKGFSVLLAFGKPCRPKIQFFTRSVRVIFGPVAVYLSFLDLDMMFVKMSQMVSEQEVLKEEKKNGKL